MTDNIVNLDENLVGIAVGVKFRANFSIEDRLGRIVDDILYKKKSPFGPALFPKVTAQVGRRTLLNESDNNTLTIDNSNFVFDLNITDEVGVDELRRLTAAFNEDIVRGVMKTYNVKEIVRIGYLHKYVFTTEGFAQRFVDRTVGKPLEGVESINLAFSKKIPAVAALAQRDVNDFHNVIFNVIKHSDKDEIFMSVDYQRLYRPPLPSVNEIDFDPFVREATQFNNNRYLRWLNANYVEA